MLAIEITYDTQWGHVTDLWTLILLMLPQVQIYICKYCQGRGLVHLKSRQIVISCEETSVVFRYHCFLHIRVQWDSVDQLSCLLKAHTLRMLIQTACNKNCTHWQE